MRKIKSDADYAVLVLSCDKYSDLWKPFFSQLHKFWPSPQLKIYLGSNTKKYPDPSITTILSGVGKDWSSDLLSILSKLKEKYVFIWVDDFFLTKTVDSSLFLQCFQFMKKHNANHMHMAPGVKPDGICENDLFGYYQKGAPYRTIVAGFWDRAHLQKLLIPGENPWKFEIMGSYRSSYSDGYYTVNKSLFEFIRVVEKGRISRQAYDYCKNHGVTLDIKKRQVNTGAENIVSTLLDSIFSLILQIPWKTRVGTMEKLRRLLVSY